MKIMIGTEWFPPRTGGVASHVDGLARELDRRGHDITIVTRKGSVEPRKTEGAHNGLEVVGMNPNPSALRRFVKENRFDVIHAHHGFTALPLLSLAVARSLRLPCVLTTHSAAPICSSRFLWLPTGFAAFPLRGCLMCTDRIIAVSEPAADFLRYFSNGKRIDVIPNGVDHQRFTRAMGQNLSFGTDRVILFVGRLVYRKGLHVLIRAAARVHDVFPDALFLIAGEGYTRPWAALLARRLGIHDNVRFLGHVPPSLLPSLYASSTVFALPSLFGESFGIVLLEAMSAGCPVVASRVGGVGEVVKDRVTGLLVEPGSAQDLAKGLVHILSDSDRARSMGKAGRSRVRSRFAWSVVAEKVERVYGELV